MTAIQCAVPVIDTNRGFVGSVICDLRDKYPRLRAWESVYGVVDILGAAKIQTQRRQSRYQRKYGYPGTPYYNVLVRSVATLVGNVTVDSTGDTPVSSSRQVRYEVGLHPNACIMLNAPQDCMWVIDHTGLSLQCGLDEYHPTGNDLIDTDDPAKHCLRNLKKNVEIRRLKKIRD